MKNKIDQMNTLISKLRDASEAYYKYDLPVMTDREYDSAYDELEQLEKETGIVLAGSPTHRVQGYVLDGFNKVTHSKPMLSAAKTKDIEEIKKFLNNNDWYCSGKLDGMTLVVIYKDGNFVHGITRGTGTVGEDVTEACRFIRNLPMQIPYKDRLELRGECVISWDEFNRINESSADKYSHPRNLAAGTLRQLDLNIVKQRELSFVVFECVTRINDSKLKELYFAHDLGFETVLRMWNDVGTVDEVSRAMTRVVRGNKYPYDGLIFEINSNSVSDQLGGTGHHELCRMALKWQDTAYETVLRDIEWNTGKSGVIFPTGIVDPVDLDGAVTSRVTLHNLSYIKDLKLGIGDTVTIYRSNMVIPAIADNLTRSGNFEIPKVCPICGSPTEIRKDNDSEFLYCNNPNCGGRLLGKFKHFVSRNAMDISGLSEETLKKFVNIGWLEHFVDIYELPAHYNQIVNLDGFGKQSADNLMKSLDESRQNVKLPNFINALSIPGIGLGQAKTLCKKYKTWFEFMDARHIRGSYMSIDGIGEVLDQNIRAWLEEDHNLADANTLANIIHFEDMNQPEGDLPLLGKTFVVTGKLNTYPNRDALKDHIEQLGGKVSGSVSKNTDYLINNDVTSTSGKNKKAKELDIPIISEDDFLKMIEK